MNVIRLASIKLPISLLQDIEFNILDIYIPTIIIKAQVSMQVHYVLSAQGQG